MLTLLKLKLTVTAQGGYSSCSMLRHAIYSCLCSSGYSSCMQHGLYNSSCRVQAIAHATMQELRL